MARHPRATIPFPSFLRSQRREVPIIGSEPTGRSIEFEETVASAFELVRLVALPPSSTFV